MGGRIEAASISETDLKIILDILPCASLMRRVGNGWSSVCPLSNSKWFLC